MTQRQQQALPRLTIGIADNTPMTAPPTSTGFVLVVVFTSQMGDQIFALEEPKRVLQFQQLNEQIMLRVQALRMDRALEVERQPLLDAVHAGALGEVEEQGHVENDGRRQDAVAAQEVDLELHRIAE